MGIVLAAVGFIGGNADMVQGVFLLFQLSAPVIKCQKTPRKKCNIVAEVKEKR